MMVPSLSVACCVWISFVLLNQYSVQGLTAPFTETPTNPTYVALGSVARLKWNFLIHGRFRVAEIQYKRGGTFKTLAGKEEDGTIQTNPNEPITKRITIEGNATLVISGVKAEDSTEYKCVLVYLNAITVQGGVTQLLLTVAPTITVPALVTINESQNLTIDCASSGAPTPNVTWVQILSNGGKIIKTEGKGSATLFEPKIKRPGGSTDKYIYECQARNTPNATAVTNRTEVIVQYLPEGTILTSSPSNIALQGDQITFTCSVSDANPSVDKFTFYFKNGNTWTPKKQNKDGVYVMNVQGSDQGAYSCVPHNAAGNGINASVWLTVNVPPNITKPPSDTVVKENEPLQLTCEASGQPTPNITWTKDRRQLFVGNTLDIKTIKRGESGTYVCNADNNVKSAKTASAQVTVQCKFRRLWTLLLHMEGSEMSVYPATI